jgi:NAD(P)H-hydrate epimerase
MRVVTTAQIREMDRRAIEEFGIPGAVLMENAGRAVVSVIAQEFGPLRRKQVAVFCGGGNNGGDGFVIARHLHLLGAIPTILLAGGPKPGTDANTHFEIARNLGIPCDGLPDRPWRLRDRMPDCELIVDALLGTGIQDAPRAAYAEAIRAVLESRAPVVSVDIPSGVNADTGAIPGEAVVATQTVTFGYPKRGLLLFPGAQTVGRLHIADIGFDWGRVAPEDAPWLLPRPEWLQNEAGETRSLLEAFSGFRLAQFPLRPRREDANKGDFGHVAILAGSRGMAGAPALAARAAQRVGAGLVTVLTAASAQPMVAAKLDEQMTVPLPETDGAIAEAAFDTLAKFAERATVFCIGPGLTTAPGTVALVQRLLTEIPKPIVLDADGLNALAKVPTCIEHRVKFTAAPLVLTPHPGEAARLLGTSIPEVESDRIGAVSELARRYKAVVALKGRYSLIADPTGQIAINTTGNPGMATGGSGDTLTGMLGGLLAQVFAQREREPSPWHLRAKPVLPPTKSLSFEAPKAGVEAPDCRAEFIAAELAVYLHGLAGDLAATQVGEAGLVAGDITALLPTAMQQLTGMWGRGQ